MPAPRRASATRGASGGPRVRRVRRVLVALPTYSEELGLDLGDRSDWFPWFLAASLFAKPIAAATAVRTAGLLLRSGVRTPGQLARTGWDGLVRLLDAGGYTRYDFSTADKLLAIARGLSDTARLEGLANEPTFSRVEHELARIRGVGPKTVEIFLRELQGVWKSSPAWSAEALQASQRLGIDPMGWTRTPANRRRLESGLVRLWIEHCKPLRWQRCPLGADCGCRPRRSRDQASR